ncbi:MAG TPA: hydroxyacylglutathione hydrolase [Xanthobacteraceae bacterium]|nr:hydroxyacylglutathione hydrolase [Xanthobacteraceae bacterium]
MSVEIRLVPCLSDNYAVLLHDGDITALIDAPEAVPIEKALDKEGWKLTHILITHHHSDHVDGIAALKKKYGAKVIGPKNDGEIPMIDEKVSEGDSVRLGNMTARVLDTPGHTAGHVSYVFDKEKLLFAADTLFVLGAGRAFEKPASVLWQSLLKLRKLPGNMKLYCGHEYTLGNARFAITVDPKNAALKKRLAEIEAARAAGKPTVPSLLSEEFAANPFMRADDPAIAEAVGMAGSDPAAVFTEIRERKNNFRG